MIYMYKFNIIEYALTSTHSPASDVYSLGKIRLTWLIEIETI